MNKRLSFCGILATAFIAATMIIVSSCSQEDDYYDTDMYTMAEELETRAGEPGNEPATERWIKAGSIDMEAGTSSQHRITFYVSWEEQTISDGIKTTVSYTILNNSSSLDYTDSLGIRRYVKRYKQTRELDHPATICRGDRLEINGVFYYAKAIENPQVNGTYQEEQSEFYTAGYDIPADMFYSKAWNL